MTAPTFGQCLKFLEAIGINVQVVPGAIGFLDNMRIVDGGIHVDPTSDNVCGNLLHEAGHIAVTSGLFRPHLNYDVQESIQDAMDAYLKAHPFAFGAEEDPIARSILQSGETEAIAWSYAAAVEIGIDSRLPFRLGFQGEGMQLHDMLKVGAYFGINGLAAAGMTKLRGPDRFPKMIRWMQT